VICSTQGFEKLLEQCRRPNCAGGQELIRMIEQTLAGAPIVELSDEQRAASSPRSSDGTSET